MLLPDRDGLHHPSTEDEVRELIGWARRRGMPLRVRGTGHSVDPAILASDGLHVALDRLDGVEFDDARMQVTVQGGRRLGGNPRDRNGRSAVESGLCWALEQRGWALPVTAGVTHQTVAGFLMTGSAGGSRRHALTEQVVGLRLIDGNGDVHDLRAGDDAFDAVGVSMGLLGVVTAVTLQCVERFDVEGEERVTSAEELDGAEALLRENEYARAYWWPQRGVDRLAVWTARSIPGPPAADARPYRLLPEIAGSMTPAQAFAGTAIGAVCRTGRWNRGFAALYNAFLPDGEQQSFRDAWWRILPQDDELDERFFDSTWCELWLPAERTEDAIARLREHYRTGGVAATGAYTLEIYAAPPSRFWMSPGYGRESTRLNVCWHERSRGDPRECYFPQFWSLLGDLDFRMHWGKHRFSDPARAAAHARAAHPRLPDFLELRGKMDPDDVFLSDYWREQLGVSGARRTQPPAERNGRAPRIAGSPGRRWPLPFKLRPSDAGFGERAPFVIDVQERLDAPAEAIFDGIVNLTGARDWLPDFVRARWVAGPNERGEQLVEETFKFMSQRVRTFLAEPGRHWMASIDACTLPLGRELMEDLELEPLPGGGTQVRWRYYYDPYPVLRPIRPLLHKEFDKMLRLSLRQLDEHLADRPAPGPDSPATRAGSASPAQPPAGR
ncbi:MAG TPA: FAD-binding protein [Thermoleophilaceae bacterium]|nr:FAD-binding protein [Thermoleophilaceae bacterium]